MPRPDRRLSASLVDVSERLSTAVDELTFGPPVAAVYNPLVYARRPHRAYLERARSGIDAAAGTPAGICSCSNIIAAAGTHAGT